MEIIPVLDIKDGKVVQANGSARADYPPLKSVLTTQSAPAGVIRDILMHHAVQTIYLADLTALEGGSLDTDLYCQLAQAFPALTLWLDAGIATRADWETVAALGVTPVIGTETLHADDLLTDEAVRQQSVLSLDYRNGALLGAAYLPPATAWPAHVILMSLNAIGGRAGPDLALLTQAQKVTERQWFMAGGVRDKADIAALNTAGAAGVLVGTALHAGML